MSMNVELLEKSFAKVRPNATQFAADFYENLFAASPAVRPLFASADMAAQRKKLMDSLVLVIENIENGDVLAKALRNLGARHGTFGVQAAHYPLVGGVLLKTLGAHLGPAWTPEVQQAWRNAYDAITALMLQGTKGHPPA
jgi:hemoglobin-like flavoprotein